MGDRLGTPRVVDQTFFQVSILYCSFARQLSHHCYGLVSGGPWFDPRQRKVDFGQNSVLQYIFMTM